MIEAQSLTRRYGATTAVNRISFRIEHNGIVGLLGHNGAGKSTVMKMLSGYLEPTAGLLTMDGRDYALSYREVQRSLGYLPEALPLYPDMLVVDYLDYVATCKGLPRRREAVREALLATDLGSRALARINTLSRGMKQRVGVAQAVLGKPRLLILDEPGNGLDPEQNQHMRDLIRRLARRATVILSTHILQEVDALCERVLIMDRGLLALDARMADLRHSCSLLLRVSAPCEALRHALEALPMIAGIQSQPDRGEYLLLLREDSDPDAAAGEVAQAVHATAAGLVALQAQRKDLETVFREATGSEAPE
ncbi:ABC transporter ATP-binding protein [Parahaliea aestuarii]|uniref:ABC transporter ATP-binding protein n=1 Tax=Parahaliea aestuarii TaxID=1852021 RepID=A0A5C9A3Y7_9GAMM|nr:ABC transporter ATP-binding protein [Parahaliea aestuarii]TXS94347.1 ABC transporter ATP-binding protein [Parahaliea aestuarii]